MQLDHKTIAEVTLNALLDIQGLLDRLDCNIIDNDGGASADVSETVLELIALHCLATGKDAIEVLKDVYPGSDEAQYEALALMIKGAFGLKVQPSTGDN